ncbi:MAG: hypothetical protein SNJ77_01110 [Cytophagales bacterium]
MNTKLSAAGFFEYNPDLDPKGQTAQMIATMIWYLVEGYYNRRYEPDFFGEGYTRYVISVPDESLPLVFYKSNFTEKWWMEVSFIPEKDQPMKTAITPCSYQDYLTAATGELPNRWIQVHSKLL